MTEEQKKWIITKGRMMDAMKGLGFPEALGDELGEIRKKANGLMQHIMKYCISG